jgi:transglutaminase-like putative cysteine protease
MNRRQFVRGATLASAALAIGAPRVFGRDSDEPAWRTFEITTHVDVLNPRARVQVWVPVPLTVATAYQRSGATTFDAGRGSAKLVKDASRGFAFVHAEWPEGQTPSLTITSRVQTRNIAVDLTHPTRKTHDPSVSRFLQPSALIPSDGIVKETALTITKGASSDVEKARAIYEWIVANTFRDPAVRGCGLGDIRGMLETKNLGGKCADLNALYVGLAHAAGLPARDAYGLRVAKSELGYKSLGLATDVASKAQHCRAEVYLGDYGWVPVDPADVRKVALEEPPGHLEMSSDPVSRARARLFGSWEMNWIAYNFEHDVALPGRSGKALPFFMYPQGDSGGAALDSLDPDAFKYTIRTAEIV